MLVLGELGTSFYVFFFSSRRRHTRCSRDWSSDVCSSDLEALGVRAGLVELAHVAQDTDRADHLAVRVAQRRGVERRGDHLPAGAAGRSEEHTSELQSRLHLVCRLLLEKKKKGTKRMSNH